MKYSNKVTCNILFLAAVVLFLWACNDNADNTLNKIDRESVKDTSEWMVNEPLSPVEIIEGLDQNKIKLGKQLFHDVRLSGDNSISCATCHNTEGSGTVPVQFASGINGTLGAVNTPTVFNAVFNFRQFWDGRAESLEEQAKEPVENPKEMGAVWSEVIAKLLKDENIVAKFEELYGELPNRENVVDAIATFERTLVTPSRFDDYLKGSDSSISEKEKIGYRLFKEYGCSSCHQGRNVGGNMFQKFGISANYFEDSNSASEADLGRYNVTGLEEDKYYFKVPSLRNVAITGPYFHNGSVNTLDSAIKVMAHYQIGRDISDEQVDCIRSFLESLTGKNQENLIQR